MKLWLIKFLGLDKLYSDIKELHDKNIEISISQKSDFSEIKSETRKLQNLIGANNFNKIGESLEQLNSKIEKFEPNQNSFTPSNVEIKNALGNTILDFELKKNNMVNLSRAKKIEGAALFSTSAINIATFEGLSQNLFYATADPSTLMAIKGGVGSAVMGSKGIAGQAPFLSAGLGAFTPILLFQATTMMVIKSAINNLAERIEALNSKIEVLLNYKEKENEATLIAINNKLITLDKQGFYTLEDFVLLEQYKSLLSIKNEQYSLLARDAINSLPSILKNLQSKEPNNTNNETLITEKKMTEKSLDFIVKVGNSISSKITTNKVYNEVKGFMDEKVVEFFKNSNGEVIKIKEAIVASKLQYFLVMSSVADNLINQAEFLELKMNQAQINPDNNRIKKAEYLSNKFKNKEVKVSEYEVSLLESLKLNIKKEIQNLYEKSNFKQENIKDIDNKITASLTETGKILDKNREDIMKLKASLNIQKPIEIAIEYKNGQENIYIMHN